MQLSRGLHNFNLSLPGFPHNPTALMKVIIAFFVPLYTQAQSYSVAIYIVGFVIGTAAVCVMVASPIVGYFVSTAAELCMFAAHLIISFSSFCTIASSFGTEVHTTCWTILGRGILASVWVLNNWHDDFISYKLQAPPY